MADIWDPRKGRQMYCSQSTQALPCVSALEGIPEFYQILFQIICLFQGLEMELQGCGQWQRVDLLPQ